MNGGIQAWCTSETESMEPIGNVGITSDGIIEVGLPERSITTLLIPLNATSKGNRQKSRTKRPARH